MFLSKVREVMESSTTRMDGSVALSCSSAGGRDVPDGDMALTRLLYSRFQQIRALSTGTTRPVPKHARARDIAYGVQWPDERLDQHFLLTKNFFHQKCDAGWSRAKHQGQVALPSSPPAAAPRGNSSMSLNQTRETGFSSTRIVSRFLTVRISLSGDSEPAFDCTGRRDDEKTVRRRERGRRGNLRSTRGSEIWKAVPAPGSRLDHDAATQVVRSFHVRLQARVRARRSR